MNEIRLPNGQKAKRVIQVFIGENDALHVAVDGVDGPPEMELVKHDLIRAANSVEARLIEDTVTKAVDRALTEQQIRALSRLS